MQRKIHNQTLFVAALSVYFGLLIVGAPPQLLAQQIKSNSFAKHLISSPKQEPTIISCEFTFTQLASLFDENVNNATPLHFSYRTDFVNQQPVNFQIIAAEGNPQIVNFLRNKITKCSLEQKQSIAGKKQGETKDVQELKEAIKEVSTELFLASGVLFDLKADKTEIVFKVNNVFASQEAAKNFANFQNELFAHARKVEPDVSIKTAKDSLVRAAINNTVISFENNQVFIVTRLPRAGLDALLEAEEQG